MGLPIQSLLLLLNEHKASPLRGPVLTLGRQNVSTTYENMLSAFRQCGIVPVPLAPSVATGPLPGVGHPGETNDIAFFNHLGLEITAMDYSDFEGAEVLQDLNQPIPDALRGKYGTIVDGGTIEHIFDVRQGFANIAALLAPGGRIIHITPCNNYVNHGFWQLSPTSFFDFYGVNEFTDISAKMLVLPRDTNPALPWHVFPYVSEEYGVRNSIVNSIDDHLGILFSATKTEHSTSDRVPTQSFYRDYYKATTKGDPMRPHQLLVQYTPERLIMTEY